jgi:hypothetical protein
MAADLKTCHGSGNQSGRFSAALALLLALLLQLLPLPAASLAASGPDPWAGAIRYRCNGEELLALVQAGAVDAPDIPNSAGGIPPGAFVVLRWGSVSLQLPRTNRAGAPSFSDGRWWWSLEDPEHPSFEQRLGTGSLERYRCDAIAATLRTGPSGSPPPPR